MSVKVRIVKDLDGEGLERLRAMAEGARKRIRVGVPDGATEEDGTPLAMIAAVHEFGFEEKGIPERPFLRTGIAENEAEFTRLNKINLKRIARGLTTVDEALNMLGVMAVGKVQEKVQQGPHAPLSPRTIRAKGSSRPLIDTGQMIQSITYEVTDD